MFEEYLQNLRDKAESSEKIAEDVRFARGPQGRTWAVPKKGKPVPLNPRMVEAMARHTRKSQAEGGMAGTYAGTVGGGGLGAGLGYGASRLLTKSPMARAAMSVGGALAGSAPGAVFGGRFGATKARQRAISKNREFLDRYISAVQQSQQKTAQAGPAMGQMNAPMPSMQAPKPMTQTMPAPQVQSQSPQMAAPGLPKLSALRLEKVGRSVGAMMAKTAYDPVMLGAGIGAGVGAGIGALSAQPDEGESPWRARARGGLVGAGVGAVTGGGIGAISKGSASGEKIELALKKGYEQGVGAVSDKMEKALGPRGAMRVLEKMKRVG